MNRVNGNKAQQNIYISHCIYKHYQNLTKHFNRVKLNHWYQGDLEEEIVTQCGNVAMLVQKPTFNVPCS